METRLKSNEALVNRMLPCQNCDEQDRATAWTEWYATNAVSSVLAFVRMQNDTSDSDFDILQDTLTTAYIEVERGRYTPHEGVPFTAYIKGIARNKIREARRRSRRMILMDELPISHSISTRRDPEQCIEHQEQIEYLQTEMSKLPPHRRKVLEGYLSGHSTDEIADMLGISTDSVRQHRCRGLRSLREQLVTLHI